MTEQSFESILDKKLLLFTGKGGVGKSYISRLCARKAAELGKRVLLIEISHHSMHQPFLGLEEKSHALQLHAPNLHHINIVYEYNFKDYVVKYLGLEKVFNQVFSQNIVRSFLRTVPGLNEITFLGRLYYECEVNEEDPYDLVIFDAFASGHFHKLMTTPDGIEKSGLVGPVLKETKNIKNFLMKKSDVHAVYITNPEHLITTEVVEFIQLLESTTPLKGTSILLNKCLHSDPADLDNWPQMASELKRYLVQKLQDQSEIVDQLGRLAEQKGHPLFRSFMTNPPEAAKENQEWHDYYKQLSFEVCS